MNRLEVEPLGDSGIEVDHHVLGHRVSMRKSQMMKLGEGDDGALDGDLPERLVELPILQQGCERVSGEVADALADAMLA